MDQKELLDLNKISTLASLKALITTLKIKYPECRNELEEILKNWPEQKKHLSHDTLAAIKTDISATISSCRTHTMLQSKPLDEKLKIHGPGGNAFNTHNAHSSSTLPPQQSVSGPPNRPFQFDHGDGGRAFNSRIEKDSHLPIRGNPSLLIFNKPAVGPWFNDPDLMNINDTSSLYSRSTSTSASEKYTPDPGSTSDADSLPDEDGPRLRVGALPKKPTNVPTPLPKHRSDAFTVDLHLNPSVWPHFSADLDHEVNAHPSSVRPHREAAVATAWQPADLELDQQPEDEDYDDAVGDDVDGKNTSLTKLQRELYMLRADQHLKPDIVAKMYKLDAELRNSRPKYQCSYSSPPYLKTEGEKKRYLRVMECLWQEGEFDKKNKGISQFVQNEGRCKLNPIFLQMKYDKATHIHLSTLEQFVLLCILIWGDCMHDARRIEDETKRQQSKDYIVLNIDIIIATFYPHPELIPEEIRRLRNTIYECTDDMETLFMKFVEESALLHGTPPSRVKFQKKEWPEHVDVSTYINERLMFNNASCLKRPIPNIMDSLAGQIDAGETGGNASLVGPQNLAFIFTGHRGTECIVHFIRDIAKSRVTDVNGTTTWFYAADLSTAIRVKFKGRNIKTSSFERVPLCTLDGTHIHATLELKVIARKVWEQSRANSTARPNGFRQLAIWCTKWLGDAGQQKLTVFNEKGLNGGRYPLLVVCDEGQKYNIKGREYVIDIQTCLAYNEAVHQYNIGNISFNEEQLRLITRITEMLKYKTLAQNDRAAHALFQTLMILLLNSRCTSPNIEKKGMPREQCEVINVHAQSLLTCSGTNLAQLVRHSDGPRILEIWTVTPQPQKRFSSKSNLSTGTLAPELVPNSLDVDESVCSRGWESVSSSNATFINGLTTFFDPQSVKKASDRAKVTKVTKAPYESPPVGAKRRIMNTEDSSPVSTQLTQDLIDDTDVPEYRRFSDGEESFSLLDDEESFSHSHDGNSDSDNERRPLLSHDSSEEEDMDEKDKKGGTIKKSVKKRTVKRRRINNRKTKQYSNKKKHSSSKKKSVITKKTKVSKSKRNNKTKTKRRRNH
jgi:hypothetical protein